MFLLFQNIMQNCIIIDMDKFAERLVKLRKRAGLNQDDLADEIGVSVDSIRRWEGEKQEPRLSELKRIAHVLGTTISELAGEDTEYTNETTQTRVVKPHQSRRNKGNKEGIIVLQQGSTRVEIPATSQGYAILKEKLNTVSIASEPLLHMEENQLSTSN